MKKVIVIFLLILYLLLKPTLAHGDEPSAPESSGSFFLNDFKSSTFKIDNNQEPEIIHIDLFPNKKLETYICGYSNPYPSHSSFQYEEEESEEQSDSILINTDAYCHLLK